VRMISDQFRKMAQLPVFLRPVSRVRESQRPRSRERASAPVELFVSAENPCPAGAEVLRIRTEDGVRLRVARWTEASASRGTVAILPGYGEFIEKYFELIGDLRSRRFDVVALDWRGHGLSDRPLGDPRKGHVDDFSFYQHDMEALQKQVLAPLCRKPWFALGHSMGGANLLAYAHAGKSPFARIVLTAPMIDITGLDVRGARALVEAFDFIGLGGFTVPGGSKLPGPLRRFETNIATSDRRRYARTAEVVRMKPSLALGDPTIGWIHAAARLTRSFRDIDYPRRIATPILVVAAGNDRRTPLAATELFASRLKAGGLVTIPHARHEILMEHDRYRNQFWAAFDAFIPGRKDEFAERLFTAASVTPRARRRL
jgi:lysophospholipase